MEKKKIGLLTQVVTHTGLAHKLMFTGLPFGFST